jgi:mRNA interferase RelE/StbE
MYEIRLHAEAVRAFRRLGVVARDQIEAAIDALAADPRPPGATILARRDDLRIRVGDDYWIMYAVDDAAGLVHIAQIAHRRKIYRR